MFESINDIRKEMHEFRANHSRYPNVVFVSKAKRREFLEMAYHSSLLDVCSPVKDFIGDITICGVKVKWTENTDGVDYIEEFERPIYEYLIEKKPIKVKSNRRKIVL